MTVTTGAQKRESYSGDYKALGKSGEAVVLEWLRFRPNVADVQDLRADQGAQYQDVDFRLVWCDGREELVEVKTDVHARIGGNVLFEVLRLHHRTDALGRDAEVGWSLRSAADWLFIYAPVPRLILYARMARLRAWFQAWSYEHIGNMQQRWIRTDCNKSTLIVLVPWAQAGHLFTVAMLPGNNLLKTAGNPLTSTQG